MGLDNGIIVKNISPEEVNSFPQPKDYWEDDKTIQLAYWRKYWGIRRDIIGVLHCEENGKTRLDEEDLKKMLKILKKYFNSNYYDDYADSIWEYDDAIEHMISNYINIKWLIEYQKNHPEAEIYFYDSY